MPPKRLDPREFLSTTRLAVVAGKGGVGKTTVTAVLARAAADAGLRVLAVDLDGKPTLADLVGDVPHLSLTAPDALADYLETHGLKRVAKRLAASGIIDVVSTAAPGIDDIVVLGKLKSLERSGDHDLIVVDGPAAGHAITFLRSASGLADAVKVGPINTQAADVLELLTDPRRCRVVLVTIPEETPVNELIETAYSLEDQVGVALGPVVVNGVVADLPGLAVTPQAAADEAGVRLLDGEADVLAAAAEFRHAREGLQQAQLDRMAAELPLPQLHLPFLFTTDVGPDDIDLLADALLSAITELPEPEAGS